MKRNKKGHFAKGNAGKPKGAISKKTKQWEALGEFITEAGAERAMRVLHTLDDKDFIDQYNKLLNYFKPRLASTDQKVQGEQKITIEHKEI